MGTLDDFKYQQQMKDKYTNSDLNGITLHEDKLFNTYTKQIEDRYSDTYPTSNLKVTDGYLYDKKTGTIISIDKINNNDDDKNNDDAIDRSAARIELRDALQNGTYVLDGDSINKSMIAGTAQDALDDNWIDSSRILTDYWKGEFDYVFRADGSIKVVTKDGVAMGFIAVDSLLDSYVDKLSAEAAKNQDTFSTNESSNTNNVLKTIYVTPEKNTATYAPSDGSSFENLVQYETIYIPSDKKISLGGDSSLEFSNLIENNTSTSSNLDSEMPDFVKDLNLEKKTTYNKLQYNSEDGRYHLYTNFGGIESDSLISYSVNEVRNMTIK